PGDREIEFQIPGAVEHKHRDAVALRHAVLPKRAGEAAHPVAKLRPCELSIAFEKSNALRIELKRAAQTLRDVHAVPPRRDGRLAVVAVGEFHAARTADGSDLRSDIRGSAL